MKKLLTLTGTFLFVSAILSSCGGPSESTKEEIVKTDTTKTIKVEDTKPKEIVLKPEDIEVKIFFGEIAHSSTEFKKSNTLGKIREKVGFQKLKNCKYNIADCYFMSDAPCHVRESFDNLSIKGKGKNISLTIENNKKVIFTKDKIDLDGEIKFSKKEIKLTNTDTKYIVIIKQGDSLLFEGTIEETSQECYHG
jgi:hypothetical protein